MRVFVRGAILLLAALGAALAAGCLSRSYPERQRFHLEAVRPGPPETACDCSARVERVRVAQLFENRSFVYQTEAGTAQEDFAAAQTHAPAPQAAERRGSRRSSWAITSATAWKSDSGIAWPTRLSAFPGEHKHRFCPYSCRRL